MAIIIHNIDRGFGKRTRSLVIPTERYSMNAKEARKLSEQAALVNMDEIYRKIESAARTGAKGTSINCEKYTEHQLPSIIKELKSRGFSVKRDRYSDFRESWDNLDISWEGPSATDYYNK